MPQTTIGRGNELYDWVIQPTTLTWSGSVSATTATELTATIPGLVAGDIIAEIVYNPPVGTAVTTALPYGFSWSNVRCNANNTLSVLWTNSTAGSLTPPSSYWYVNILRLETPGNLPTSAG